MRESPKETTLLKSSLTQKPSLSPRVLELDTLSHVNQVVLNLVPCKNIIGPLAVLTGDQWIQEIVKGIKLDFTETPSQKRIPKDIEMPESQKALVEEEIKELLRKGAISQVNTEIGQFISTIFLTEKRNGKQRPIINLKNLNFFIVYEKFKMENLKELKDLLKEGDLMMKLDMKDAYFNLLLHQNYRKFVRFTWKETLYEFTCICFGLGPGPRFLSKLLKVLIQFLRRLNIRLVIYLDDILVLGETLEIILQARDTILYLL